MTARPSRNSSPNSGLSVSEVRVEGSRFGFWDLGFGIWGLGLGVWGLRFGVWGLGFEI